MDIVSSPKTDMFRMRINSEVRQNLEAVYAKNGLILTDAVNVFFQQSLNAYLILEVKVAPQQIARVDSSRGSFA